jgi:hypothetical protein
VVLQGIERWFAFLIECHYLAADDGVVRHGSERPRQCRITRREIVIIP